MLRRFPLPLSPYPLLPMKLLKTIAEVRDYHQTLSGTLGFVPTMGYLHQGHLSLVERARAENDHVAVSIFVNPTQFDRPDDLARYPRDLERDLALLENQGVTFVFAPTPEEIYPPRHSTSVTVTRVTDGLEGAHRPGHFNGVATVVCKLFNIVQPTRAYFGQKDAQQVVVVRRMTQDLNLPVDVIACPTLREADGLALSSRNVFLEGEERLDALALSRTLFAVRAAWEAGERDANALRSLGVQVFATYPTVRLEYFSCTDPDTLEVQVGEVAQSLVSTAAWVGKVRLIDNLLLHP
jgi:pantoate--beta-alanine ligase